MPPLPTHPGVLKIDHRFTIGQDLGASCRLHFSYTGTPPTNTTCATIAATIGTHFATRCQGLMGDDTTFTELIVTDLSSSTGGSGVAPASVTGTRGAGVLPAEVCALQNFTIARRYRGGKPRVYWPFGVDNDLQDPQTWTAGFITAVETATGNYFTDIVASGTGGCTIVELVSISDYHSFTLVVNPITGRGRNVPTPRTVALSPDPVLSIPLNPKVGSQRRRSLHGR